MTNGGLTVFTVFRATDVSQQRFLMVLPEVNCSNNFELGYSTGDGDRANFGIHSGCSNATLTQADIGTGFETMTVRVRPTLVRPDNVEIFRGGAQQSLEIDQSGWTDGGFYPTSSGLTFGSRGADGFHQGDIAEVLVFDRDLDEPERQAVEDYLRSKYVVR